MRNSEKYNLATRYRLFAKDESGSSTIEAVLWLPMFMLLLSMVADASFIFHGQAQALRIVQDGNRAFSVGRLEDTAATQAYIRSNLISLSRGARVTTTLSGGIITTTALISVDDLLAIGSVGALTGFDITVKSQHFLEY